MVELVDRQFAFLSTRDADRLLMTVSRVLTLMKREPTLAAILDDFEDEVREAVAEYHAHERWMMSELRDVFTTDRDALFALAEANVEGFDLAAVEGYIATLVPLDHHDYPSNEEPKWDRAASRHRLSKLRFWMTAVRERSPTVEGRARLLNVEERLIDLRERHEEAFRAYRTLGVTLPGAARARLEWAVGCLNPSRARKATDEAELLREREDLASMLHEPTKRRLLTNAPGSEIVGQARRDAELLREEIVLALGRPAARHGRLRNFVEKIQRFQEDAIAKAFAGRSTKTAEGELARKLAEHYFEGGERATWTVDRHEDGALLVQARFVAKPTAASARKVVGDVLSQVEDAAERRGAKVGAVLIVQNKAPRIVLPREVRRAGATLLVETLPLGRSRDSAPLVVEL